MFSTYLWGVAASVRGDEAEQDRLQSSAPEHLFCVPDYRGYSEGFNEVASLYLIQQLETGGVLEVPGDLRGSAKDESTTAELPEPFRSPIRHAPPGMATSL